MAKLLGVKSEHGAERRTGGALAPEFGIRLVAQFGLGRDLVLAIGRGGRFEPLATMPSEQVSQSMFLERPRALILRGVV